MVMSADVYHVILGAKASGYMAGARWTHPPICPRQTKNNTLTSFVLRVQKQTDATQYKPISSLELSGGKYGLSTLRSWDLHISASIECRHRIGPRFYPWPAATVNKCYKYQARMYNRVSLTKPFGLYTSIVLLPYRRLN